MERAEVDRCVGLSLGGAKSERTCMTVIDIYRKQEKAFVVDVFEGIGPASGGEDANADRVLLQLIEECQPGIKILATDAPLTLPPCLKGCEASCLGYERCKRPEVKWMRNQYQKAVKNHKKLKHFTPYGQRPVDLYFRYKHPGEDLFQDETMGANVAPQAARMQYLKRHLKSMRLIEVWPKLVLFEMVRGLKLSRREVLNYRHLERGVVEREHILERIVEKTELFIYERDCKKLVSNMYAFDSFLCAWVALLYDQGKTVKIKGDLPLESGWVQIPEL